MIRSKAPKKITFSPKRSMKSFLVTNDYHDEELSPVPLLRVSPQKTSSSDFSNLTNSFHDEEVEWDLMNFEFEREEEVEEEEELVELYVEITDDDEDELQDDKTSEHGEVASVAVRIETHTIMKEKISDRSLDPKEPKAALGMFPIGGQSHHLPPQQYESEQEEDDDRDRDYSGNEQEEEEEMELNAMDLREFKKSKRTKRYARHREEDLEERHTKRIKESSQNVVERIRIRDYVHKFPVETNDGFHKTTSEKTWKKYSDGYMFSLGGTVIEPSIMDSAFDNFINSAIASTPKENEQFGLYSIYMYTKMIRARMGEDAIVSSYVMSQFERFLLDYRSKILNSSDRSFLEYLKKETKGLRSNSSILPYLSKNSFKLETIVRYFTLILNSCYLRSNYYVDVRHMWYPKFYDFLYSLSRFFEDAASAEHFLLCSKLFIFDTKQKLETLAVKKTHSTNSNFEILWRVYQTALARMFESSKEIQYVETCVEMIVDLMADIWTQLPLDATRFAGTIGGLFDAIMGVISVTRESYYLHLQRHIAVRTTNQAYPRVGVLVWINYSKYFLEIIREYTPYFINGLDRPPQRNNQLSLESFVGFYSKLHKQCDTREKKEQFLSCVMGFIEGVIVENGYDTVVKDSEFEAACKEIVGVARTWSEVQVIADTICPMVLSLFS